MGSLRAVLCDLDDTLFDHSRGTRLALAEVRAVEAAFSVWSIEELDARHRVALEKWHQRVLGGDASIDVARVGRFAELLAAAGAGADEARAVEVASIYRQAYARMWHPVAGAVELLAAIKAAGLRLAIVTNNVIVEQQLKLDRCGLAPYVDALVTSEEIGVQKPDAAIFEAALERVDAAPGEAVMLNDAWHADIAGAHNAGIRPVWFNRFAATRPNSSISELRSLEPTANALTVILTETAIRSRRDV
jgi:HAD superfamily hydrolase (TIGR01509 family)